MSSGGGGEALLLAGGGFCTAVGFVSVSLVPLTPTRPVADMASAASPPSPLSSAVGFGGAPGFGELAGGGCLPATGESKAEAGGGARSRALALIGLSFPVATDVLFVTAEPFLPRESPIAAPAAAAAATTGALSPIVTFLNPAAAAGDGDGVGSDVGGGE